MHPESSSKASPQRLQKVGTMLVVPDVTAMLFQLKLRTYLDPKMLYERLVTYFTLPVNRSKKANRKLLIDRSPNLTISDVSLFLFFYFSHWGYRHHFYIPVHPLPLQRQTSIFPGSDLFILIFSKSLSNFFCHSNLCVTSYSHLQSFHQPPQVRQATTTMTMVGNRKG